MFKVWWFNEYSIENQVVYDAFLDLIELNFKKFNYNHIETPVVEKNEVLLSKWWEDISKQIFGLYWLAQWVDDIKKYSLRFDQTIPFARFVVDNFSNLLFPFKKYQIWKVRRWERQQKWRFKEFTQADIDVIRNQKKFDNLFYYDAEIIVVLCMTIFDIVGVCDKKIDFTVNINNKLIIESILKKISSSEIIEKKLVWIVDKFHKLSKSNFIEELSKNSVSDEDIDFLVSILSKEIFFEDLPDILNLIDDDNYRKWVNDLISLLEILLLISSSLGIDIKYKIDFSIIRGFDYYTGTVFEIFIDEFPEFWSICSWWRYDKLTNSLSSKINCSWVGGSIGIDRLYSIFLDKKITFSQKDFQIWPDYFFLNFDETNKEILSIMLSFLKKWKSVEIYPFEDKFKKQLDFANKRLSKNVVIFWQNEKSNNYYIIKNMKTWNEQKILIN